MSFDFDGYVLRAAQIAPTNATTTGEPLTGVIRFPCGVPQSYTLTTGAPLGEPPVFVDPAADQYRAAILDAPGTTPQEYLVWAANSSQLTLDNTWWCEDGTGAIPKGTLTVYAGTQVYEDGSDLAVVTDNGIRSLAGIVVIVVARGDVVYDDDGWKDPEMPLPSDWPLEGYQPRKGTNPYLTFAFDASHQDIVAGTATLDALQLVPLDGGLSQDREDSIVLVRYTLAESRCWWTRNDRYETRFGWSGKNQRWEPYKGTAAINLGLLEENQQYPMSPKVTNLPIGSLLPGSSAPDSYSMLRAGGSPGLASIPVDKVEVVADALLDTYDFGAGVYRNAVVGQSTGVLQFNPEFIQANAGMTLWYSYKGFQASADGVVGPMRGADLTPLYLTPLPGPTDYPFIRFGNRSPLAVTLFSTEAALASAAEPSTGSVYVALSTGRLRFNTNDLRRSDPDWPVVFDKQFFGDSVIYAGVALNSIPQPSKRPVQLWDQAGNPGTALSSQLYIPKGSLLPQEFVLANPWRGLGTSGTIDAPDGTGALPAWPGVEAGIRPGGDDMTGPSTGRVRQVPDGVGDTILFSKLGAISNLRIVDKESDLPGNPFQLPKNQAFVAREFGAQGSQVVLGWADRKRFGANPVYFLQSTLTPAGYTTVARIYARNRDIFRFDGDELLYFAINGVAYQWASADLLAAYPTVSFFTTVEVAASLQADSEQFGGAKGLLAGATAGEFNGYLYLDGGVAGSVEIGFGTDGEKDLSGCAQLGFLPGWRVADGVDNWLPDSGASLGLTRSPVNLDRSSATPDLTDRGRLTGAVLSDSVQETPFVFPSNIPLQDVAGLDDGVFFSLTTTLVYRDSITVVQRPLQNYTDIIHRFGQGRFEWIERNTASGSIDQAVSVLNLGHSNVVPESLLAAPGIGGGFYLSEDGGAVVFQDPDNDFLLDPIPGNAALIERFGQRVTYGTRGNCTGGTGQFSDFSTAFDDPARLVAPGYRLKILSGANAGSYLVGAVTTHQMDVTPPFRVSTTLPVPWEVYTAYPISVYDPGLLADISYKGFNHLQSEPFQIFVLHYCGLVPATQSPRLKADMAGSIQSGRDISLRFGMAHAAASVTASLTGLLRVPLGTLANDALAVPNPVTDRFVTGAFSIQVGTTIYGQGTGLVGVVSFSPDPTSVEYLISSGELKFGTTVFTQHTGATVVYKEEFLDPALLAAGTAEYEPTDGSLNLAASDLVAHLGQRIYFVERLITEGQLDVAISPMLGAFSPNVPLSKGCVVEAVYYQADLEGRKVGNQISEFLSVFIRKEMATLVYPGVYQFNAAGNTIDTRIEPSVWIGAVAQNFGRIDCVLSYPNGPTGLVQITFSGKTVSATDPVSVTYAVFELQGGERAFETSQKNVYRPPFFIKANQSQFGLRGNRVSEFEVGQLIRIGEDCFYICSLTYFPPHTGGGDVTGVGIFPPTVSEVGTRAPGNDVLTVISSEAVTTVVDPDGTSPVPTTAPAGFMSVVNLSTFPFEPVSRGQKTIIFKGDLTQRAIPGYVLELGGCPYTIASRELSEDGSRTSITVTGGFFKGFDAMTLPTVKISYRPIYPPSCRGFLSGGPIVETEPVELVLFGETDALGELPGRTLVPESEYQVDYTTGQVTLLDPLQAALAPRQRLMLSYTRSRMVQPFMQNRAVILPTLTADYLYTTIPSTENSLLGSVLTGTYTFANPDTFYFRAVKLNQFLGEAAQAAVLELSAQQPSNGPIIPASGSNNWNQGRFGILGERQCLLDKDRAARSFLTYYNDMVVSFEQVQETISGGIVGDRDGKFRFWIGHGKDYPTPGYENDISGLLPPRNIWSEVFNANRTDDSILPVTLTDWVVLPQSATLVAAMLTGTFPPADDFNKLLSEQGVYVRNDVDDLVMVRLGRTVIDFTAIYPFFRSQAKGKIQPMYEEHRFSRLFPTITDAFLRLYPGAGADMTPGVDFDPGVYTAGREIDGKERSTRNSQIGQLGNPVLGEIEGVKHAALQLRRARARIWAYLPDGLPAGAFDGGASLADPRPCVIAFPTLLADVPIDPATGYPDNVQLLSQSLNGTIPDLVAGDPVLAVPGFVTGDQISFGKPTGDTYQTAATTLPAISVFGADMLRAAFVASIDYGCVIFFQDATGGGIGFADQLLVKTSGSEGIPAYDLPLETGDTIYAVVGSGGGTAALAPADNTTFETFAQAAANVDNYRENVDFDVKKDGRIIDRTLWSFYDPSIFGLKELTGQNPPPPMGALEGPVEFNYEGQAPLLIPALEGKTQNDSGDYTLPYLRIGATEKDRFSQVSIGLSRFMADDSFAGEFVYPDEVVGTDGYVVGAGDYPAVLLTHQDLFPVAHGSTDPGIGDVRPCDLLLIQAPAPGEASQFTTGGGLNLGPHGVQVIGAVTSPLGGLGQLEPTRFVTHTNPPAAGSTATGDSIRYLLENAIVHVAGPYPPTPQAAPGLTSGVSIIERPAWTILNFDSTTIVFNDGAVMASGNLNDLAATARITIRVIARPDNLVVFGPAGPNPLPSLTGGVEALRIVLDNLTATAVDYQGNVYGPIPMPFPAIFGTHEAPVPPDPLDCRQIHMAVNGLIPWVPVGPLPPGWATNLWFLPYNIVAGDQEMIYAMEVIIDVDTRATPLESPTGWLGVDRLTFWEVYDLRHAQARGTVHSLSPLSLETRLTVMETQTGQGAATEYWSTVNRWCNGWDGGLNPYPFTFVQRDLEPTIGTWTKRVGPVTERGRLKLMAFEGWNNTAITTVSDVTFSAIPSCDYATGAAVTICEGTGLSASQFNLSLPLGDRESCDSRLRDITVLAGDITEVEKGDLVVIKASANATHPGSLLTGTYLVRHNVIPNNLGLPDRREVSPLATAGSTGGWAQVHFPTVVSYDVVSHTLVISDLAPAAGGPLIGGQPCGFSIDWAAHPHIYILVNPAHLAAAGEVSWRQSVIRAEYTAIALGAGNTGEFTLAAPGPFPFQDARGNLITEADFAALATSGLQVSGMVYWPVQVSNPVYGLPDNNCVGYDGVPGDPAIYGFRRLTFVPPQSLKGFANPADDAQDVVFQVAGVVPLVAGAIAKVGAADTVVPMVETPPDYSYQFFADPAHPVYHWVTHTLDVSNVSNTLWSLLNIPTGSWSAGIGRVNCILPETALSLRSPDGAGVMTPGFLAQTGIFLEPSWPRTGLDLTPVLSHAHVVDRLHSLPDPSAAPDQLREIGMRDAEEYWVSGAAPTVLDEVIFTVRRIRRFHDGGVQQNLRPLRFAYEIRRGFITNYVSTGRQNGVVVADGFTMDWEASKPAGAPKAPDVWNDGLTYTGTNLGPFDNPDVNIHPGDTFKLLDENNIVVEEAAVSSILGPGRIQLAIPGLTKVAAGVTRFEIWIHQAPVPHEQSNEELLSRVIDREVTRTEATWGAADELGGHVPDLSGGDPYATSVNKLQDDLNATGVAGKTFSALGVRKGDIIVIDPLETIPQKAGLPAAQERAVRPMGDEGVTGRVDHAGAPVYTAGRPNPLDDNRGYYRVTAVVDTATPPHLLVDPVSTFSGTAAAPVIFDSADNARAYAIYPTVNASTLGTGGKEAQLDLRPTLARDPASGSFKVGVEGLRHSIRPFSYRIVRPTALFTDETIDLVLSTRERLLTLADMIRRMARYRGGDYFIFQRDVHIAELGDPLDPEIGLGVMSNLYLRMMAGRVDVMPFANGAGCMSLLDRRFWILDERLDSLTYAAGTGIGMQKAVPGDPTYTAYTTAAGSLVRPVLPDLVDEVLMSREQLRPLRYAWLSYRTHRLLGTLAAIRRFDAELPGRLLERQNYLLKKDSLEKA